MRFSFFREHVDHGSDGEETCRGRANIEREYSGLDAKVRGIWLEK